MNFCTSCGTAVPSPALSPNPRPATVALQDTAVSDFTELERLAAEHPEDESYRKLLAVQLRLDAIKDWWEDPESRKLYCTSFEQLQHARRQLTRALGLEFDDLQLRGELQQQLSFVGIQEGREYTGNWFMIILLGLFYIVPGFLWWYVNRRPRYLINLDYIAHRKSGRPIGAAAKMGGTLGKIGEWFEQHGGEWGSVIGLVAICFFGVFLSPIFMILAYKENYLDVTNPTA